MYQEIVLQREFTWECDTKKSSSSYGKVTSERHKGIEWATSIPYGAFDADKYERGEYTNFTAVEEAWKRDHDSAVNFIDFSEFVTKPIGEFDSWETWHIIPSARPAITPPDMKTSTVDIPARYGVFDLSTVLTNGRPIFKNRTGSFDLTVLNRQHDLTPILGKDYVGVERSYRFNYANEGVYSNKVWNHEWNDILSDMLDNLNGQEVWLMLQDDATPYPGYSYHGRLFVSQWKSEDDLSKVTFKYDFDPWKRENLSSIEDWLWDPFNFPYGIIREYGNLAVSPSEPLKLTIAEPGTEPVSPVFTPSVDMVLHFYNLAGSAVTADLPANIATQVLEFAIERDGNHVVYITSATEGTVSIEYRVGRL